MAQTLAHAACFVPALSTLHSPERGRALSICSLNQPTHPHAPTQRVPRVTSPTSAWLHPPQRGCAHLSVASSTLCMHPAQPTHSTHPPTHHVPTHLSVPSSTLRMSASLATVTRSEAATKICQGGGAVGEGGRSGAGQEWGSEDARGQDKTPSKQAGAGHSGPVARVEASRAGTYTERWLAMLFQHPPPTHSPTHPATTWLLQRPPTWYSSVSSGSEAEAAVVVLLDTKPWGAVGRQA